jgi:hypothetical protein
MKTVAVDHDGGPAPRKNQGVQRLITIDGRVIPAEYKELSLDRVRLSARNPRIRRLLKTNPSPSDEEIQKFLLDEDGVAYLQKQIRDNGGLVDPIIVNDKFEVVEGNCRTAVYLKLRNGRPQDEQWKTIPAYVLGSSVNTREVLILQAIYHVHSNKIKWGAYEQQAHLQTMRNEKMEPAEIARVLGLSVNEINTLLDAYDSMTKHYVSKTAAGEEKRVWSHFLEFHKNPNLAKFRQNEENVKTFAKLVKEGKIKKGADVRKLPAIVAQPKALQKLEKQGLDAAISEVGKGDPSKVYPLFKQMRKMTTLLKELNSAAIQELKLRTAEQQEVQALYRAIVDVARAASVKLV